MVNKNKNELNFINLNLAINILKEENIINEIIALKLNKQHPVKKPQDMLVLLKHLGIELESEAQRDIFKIYKIISREGIKAGDYKTIKVRVASGIRGLIGKWNPPSGEQMKIGEVLNDIFARVSQYIQGEAYYYTGKSKDKRSCGKYAYKLIVSENIAIFIDFNRKISYHIVVSCSSEP